MFVDVVDLLLFVFVLRIMRRRFQKCKIPCHLFHSFPNSQSVLLSGAPGIWLWGLSMEWPKIGISAMRPSLQKWNIPPLQKRDRQSRASRIQARRNHGSVLKHCRMRVATITTKDWSKFIFPTERSTSMIQRGNSEDCKYPKWHTSATKQTARIVTIPLPPPWLYVKVMPSSRNPMRRSSINAHVSKIPWERWLWNARHFAVMCATVTPMSKLEKEIFVARKNQSWLWRGGQAHCLCQSFHLYKGSPWSACQLWN
jgi:hypothetical protein